MKVSATKVAPVPSSDEDVQQFVLAFGMAVRNPNFMRIATKAAKNLEDMCASVPGLANDPVACAFLTKPELMLSLQHPDTFKYVAEKHPGLIEVANNLSAIVLESGASKDSNEVIIIPYPEEKKSMDPFFFPNRVSILAR